MNKEILDIYNIDLVDYVAAIRAQKFTATDGVNYFLNKIKNDKHNAVLETFTTSALDAAKIIDKKIANGHHVGRLCGAPIIIKDNILYSGHIASAGSKMLEKFVAPYTATIVEKMLAEDAIILGRANMDEFAMGTTGETSTYGAAINSKSNKHVAGGSSSGSASAVGLGLCAAAIGTDTGGSIRCPAAWNGLYALKPTYGTVSRYGIVAFASSLDQAGPICKSTADTALLLDVIRGKDIHDATSLAFKKPTKAMPKKLKIGYVKEVWKHADTIQDFKNYEKLFEKLKDAGHQIVPISIANIDLALATYYIIAPAEAASNLARFDGVRYTSAPAHPKNLDELYKKTRTDYFGDEVKRRINLGNYVLSSGYFDAFYGKAKCVQADLKNDFARAFEKCDVMIIPTTPGDAPPIGYKFENRVEMYLIDLFTVTANITGMPALTAPFGTGKQGLPMGMQILGNHFDDDLLIDVYKEVIKHGTQI
jgi:aspartyl-tRNA(Asn)/glutamyl-tRNA(Gln) amidotransferase subunit A